MRLPENTGGDFTPPPEGTHLAISYRLIDLGTQAVDWQGQVKHQHKVLLSWELPNETMDDGQPFSIHQRYTLSSHEKARLRQDLEAWRGKKFSDADFGNFDIRNVLGKPCLLTILHNHKNGSTYANIAAVASVPRGMDVPAAVNPVVYLSLSPEDFNREVFEALSDGLKQAIMKSPEYADLNGKSEQIADAPPPSDNDLDDEIPF